MARRLEPELMRWLMEREGEPVRPVDAGKALGVSTHYAAVLMWHLAEDKGLLRRVARGLYMATEAPVPVDGLPVYEARLEDLDMARRKAV